MTARGCNAGCWTALGLVLVFIGSFNASSGPFSVVAFFLALGLLAFVFAGGQVAALRREQRLAAGRLQQQRERLVLQVAAGHDGQVTPAMVALNVPGVTVAAAQDMLRGLAADGFCIMESNAHGQVYYQFDLGQRPEGRGSDLSPAEWVDAMSRRRMTESPGPSDSTLLSGDS